MAHWVFSPDGWAVKQLGVLDYSGGTVVELGSGAAGLALAIVAGKRADFERQTIRPHNLPLVVIGLGLLWFGWFGFNAGAYLNGPHATAMAFLNTQLSAGAAMAGWSITAYWHNRAVSLLDMSMGAVTGMVAMTPACADLTPVAATVIGTLAGLTCAFAISWKYRLGVDDTLDVVGIHGWGGLFGMLAAGLAARGTLNGSKGIFYGGSWDLFEHQLTGVVVLGLFSFVMTALIGFAIEKTVGLRQPGGPAEDEQVYEQDVATQLEDVAGALRGPAAPLGEEGASKLLTQLREMLAQHSDTNH
jgi:Amt family ammonium transporter